MAQKYSFQKSTMISASLRTKSQMVHNTIGLQFGPEFPHTQQITLFPDPITQLYEKIQIQKQIEWKDQSGDLFQRA